MTEIQKKAILLMVRAIATANRREGVESASGHNDERLEQLRERSIASSEALAYYLDSLVDKGEI